MEFIHNIGKRIREEIILTLLSNRSKKELASLMGVSQAAITKFTKGEIHPSDESMMRLINSLNEEEKRTVFTLIFKELAKSIEEVLNGYIKYIDKGETEHEMSYLVEKIIELYETNGSSVQTKHKGYRMKET